MDGGALAELLSAGSDRTPYPMPIASPAAAANSPRTMTFARAASCIGMAALMVLTLAHPSTSRMHTWPWSALVALLALLPMLLLVQIAVSGTWRLPNGTATAGLLLLAIGSVVSAAASPYADAVMPRTWHVLGCVALGFVLHHAVSASATARKRLTLVLAWTAALIVAASLVLWTPVRLQAGWAVRNTFPFGHSTYTGGVLVLLIPWLVLQAMQTNGVQRAIWSLVGVLAGVAVSTTSSRGAVLALAVTAGGACLAALVFAPWSRSRKILLMAAALAVATAGILTNPRLREAIRTGAWGDSASESNRQRSAMLTGGRILGAQRPLLGWGPGAVPLAYPRVRAELDGGVANVLQLHSTPLQAWATLGTTGVAAALLLAAGVFVAGLRAVRNPELRAESVAGLASLGGYAVFSLTDHQLDVPMIAALVIAAAALLTGTAGARSLTLSRGRAVATIVGGTALAAFPAMALLNDLRARQTYDEGIAAWERGASAEFVARMDQAASIARYDAFYPQQAAGELMRRYEAQRTTASYRAQAIERLQASLRTQAHEEFAHYNLGWLRLESGEPALAAPHFVAAARLVPDRSGVYFGLGLALQQQGRTRDALRAFALEWLSDPRHCTSPAWEVPALAALYPEVRNETLRLLADLAKSDATAAKGAPWLRWWLGEPVEPHALGSGFNAQAATFARALPKMLRREAIAGDAAWVRLYHAWRNGARNGFAALAGNDRAFAEALQRRATRHRDEFRAFLAAPTGDEAALFVTTRHQRLGYGVLALHPDGPLLTDNYIVQENRVTVTFAAELFPPKGWLPARFLLALLPPVTR